MHWSDVRDGRDIGVVEADIEENREPEDERGGQQECKEAVDQIFEGESSQECPFTIVINDITQQVCCHCSE